jgi:hypothetical protein
MVMIKGDPEWIIQYRMQHSTTPALIELSDENLEHLLQELVEVIHRQEQRQQRDARGNRHF